ncbi:hypothetical protein AB0G00_12270 [Nocardia salmonicida]|uniref:hypothetical protein n=1 Tax=Nocardia salmonicida TaxID=53431 RepID=UPI0033DD7470
MAVAEQVGGGIDFVHRPGSWSDSQGVGEVSSPGGRLQYGRAAACGILHNCGPDAFGQVSKYALNMIVDISELTVLAAYIPPTELFPARDIEPSSVL